MSVEQQPARRAQAARRVDPHLMFGISLFLALAVSWPALSGAMHGNVDIIEAGIHLLVAMAISWAGCYGVGSLMYGYAQSTSPASREAAPAAADGGLQRRAGDTESVALPAGTTDVVVDAA